MKHKCENFIEGMSCMKCGTPEWALYFPEFKHKMGSKVRIPQGYTNEGEVFLVLKKLKNNTYAIGNSKHDLIESYSWWEIYPIR